MICECCCNDLESKDFINKNKKCYRCVYAEKINKTIKKIKKCKWCEKEYILGRRLYCSSECAQKSQDHMSANAWFRNK